MCSPEHGARVLFKANLASARISRVKSRIVDDDQVSQYKNSIHNLNRTSLDSSLPETVRTLAQTFVQTLVQTLAQMLNQTLVQANCFWGSPVARLYLF